MLCCYGISVFYYSTKLKITVAQEKHIKDNENAKDFVIPGIDPHCYKNFIRDYKRRSDWVEN